MLQSFVNCVLGQESLSLEEQTKPQRLPYAENGVSSAASVLLQLAAAVVGAAAYDNGVALTPPMGWNSWNHFHGLVSAEVLATTADAFVSLGLTAAGYQYTNTDDCWSELTRDNVTRRIVPGPNFGGSEAT